MCSKNFSNQPFATKTEILTTLTEKAFDNIVKEGENVGYQHFLLFPKWFLPFHSQ